MSGRVRTLNPVSALVGVLIGSGVTLAPILVREFFSYRLTRRRDALATRRRYLEEFQRALDAACSVLKDIGRADLAAHEAGMSWRDREVSATLDDAYFVAQANLSATVSRLRDEEIRSACSAIHLNSLVIACSAGPDTTESVCAHVEEIWNDTTIYVGEQLRALAA